MSDKWYNKYNRKIKNGSLLCPYCSKDLGKQIIYFFEPTDCRHCGTSLGYIDISPYEQDLYIIDLSRAPELFRVIFQYLSNKSHKEGFNEMKTLVNLFKELNDRSNE